MTTDRPLTLDVTDFGPIARACVELRPLTVFVGPSNTGKSWLATLAYALHRYFDNGPRGMRSWFQTGFEEPTLPEGARKDVVDILGRLTLSRYLDAEMAEKSVTLTPPVEAAVRLHLREQGAPLVAEIKRCLGVDAGDALVRHGSGGRACVLLRHAVDGVPTPAVHKLVFGDREWTFRSTIPDRSRIRACRDGGLWAASELMDLLKAVNEPETVQTRRVWDAVGVLARDVLPMRGRTFYLPADRTGLVNAHSAIIRALIQSATIAGTGRADPGPALSGVRGDFLEQLAAMASARPTRSGHDREALRGLGKRIEDGILRGAVELGVLPGVGYPRFTYRPSGWESDLPLTNTSSMVSELAPVVLYLRHVAAPDDLLIIDEPEAHLHPAMQVALMRQIAAIVRARVRVILTTHSEWVLEELGNIVGRSRQTDRGDGESGAGSLAARDVGVWLFEPAKHGNGSSVKEITLDEDTGLYPSGFDAVATALHNDWARIAGPSGDAK